MLYKNIKQFVFILLLLSLFFVSSAYCEIKDVQTTPDGQYRLSLADFETIGVFEVYRARPWMPSTSWNHRLSGAQLVDWNVTRFEITTDSQSVRFVKGCETCYNGYSYARWWIGPILGDEPILSLELFINGFNSGGIEEWQ